MPAEELHRQLYTPDYVERNFTRLRRAAVEDLTRYTSGWSIYSISFLNAVAELQGVEARLGSDIVTALRRDAKRVRDPRIAELLTQARDARSMKVEEIIGRVLAEAAAHEEESLPPGWE